MVERTFDTQSPTRQPAESDTTVNVGSSERVCSVVSGGVLACYGLSQRSLTGSLLALLGGGLIWRGVSGWCQLYRAFGVSTADDAAQSCCSTNYRSAATPMSDMQPRQDDDAIDEASEASFPASDPPSSNFSRA